MRLHLALRAAWIGWQTLLVLLPVAAVAHRAAQEGLGGVTGALADPIAQAALGLSVGLGFVCAAVHAVLGTALAWALVRWDFVGRVWLQALIDLPLAVPTLVAGLLVVALTGPATPLGRGLEAAGLPVSFAVPGVVLALLFVTLPNVVRTVKPVLEGLDPAEEEAAILLGASDARVLRSVVLPPLVPAIGAGCAQVFGRCVAEFGAVAAVSGNIPGKTLTASVWVLGEVEAGDLVAASVVSLVLLAAAVLMHGLSLRLSRWAGARRG